MQTIQWIQDNIGTILMIVMSVLYILERAAAIFVKIAKLTPWSWDDKPAADLEGFVTRVEAVATQIEDMLKQAGVNIPPAEK